MPPSTKHIAVIGAGPAGLMAAEYLAHKGFAVTVYDHMPTPARKLLIAGRGGLNLTHSEPLDSFLTRYGAAADWLAPSIRAFTPEHLRNWCESLGQPTFVGSSGRVFPESMKAVALLRAWLARLQSLGVVYKPRHLWKGWQEGKLVFDRKGSDPIYVEPAATLLALGGASWPNLGSTGGWTHILAGEGIAISPLRPANCGFIVPWSEHVARHAGDPLKPIAVTHQNVTHRGEAMITGRGIEGGVIYAHAAALRRSIETHGSALLELDLRPSMTLPALTRKLSMPRRNQSLSTFLRKAGFPPLAIALLREATPAEELAACCAETLAARLKSLPLILTAPAPIARAISSAGGIEHNELNAAFMLRRKPGVFAAGEMLDWEAPTGGYLLQACFSTALMAAKGMVRFLNTP